MKGLFREAKQSTSLPKQVNNYLQLEHSKRERVAFCVGIVALSKAKFFREDNSDFKGIGRAICRCLQGGVVQVGVPKYRIILG